MALRICSRIFLSGSGRYLARALAGIFASAQSESSAVEITSGIAETWYGARQPVYGFAVEVL